MTLFDKTNFTIEKIGKHGLPPPVLALVGQRKFGPFVKSYIYATAY